MIKKITLSLIIFIIITACGKKGNPEYIDSSKKTELKNIIIKKV